MGSKTLKKIFMAACLIGISQVLALHGARALSPTMITGEKLGEALGQKITRLQVYKKDSSGQVQVIPFQIDEREAGGKVGRRPWAMERGSSQGDGLLDLDEAILFFSADAGERASAQDFPQAEKIWEVKAGPSATGYVYVVAGSEGKAASSTSYIKYDPGMDRISSSFYEVGFSKKRPLIQDYLKIKNGSLPYDVLDRFKARFYLDIKNFFNLKIDEDEVKSQLIGVKVGPIRILRRVVASKSLGPIKVIPRSSVDFFFYPDWLEVSTQINNPVDGPKMLGDKTLGKSGFDFKQLVFGSDLFTNLGGTSLRLDGKNSGAQKKISGENLRWWSMRGLSGSMVNGLKNDPQLRNMGIHPYLIINNDPNAAAAPESERGEVFVGFDMPYHKIPKGRYAIKVTQAFPKNFRHGQENTYLENAKTLDPIQIQSIK